MPSRSFGVSSAQILSGQTEEATGHRIAEFTSGQVLLDADFNGDTISFKMSDAIAGTYTALAGVSFLAVTGWNPLPAELFRGGLYFKSVTNAAVGANRTNNYQFKS